MRNTHRLLILTIATLAFANVASAATVNVQSAQSIAVNFFKINAHVSSKTTINAELKFTKTETDGTVDFYVFDINPAHGFVIISADDNITPVIGYSTEANFNNNFNNTAVADWMNHASVHIYKAITEHVAADAHISSLWSSYAQGNNPSANKSLPVAPLLTTTWDQEPFYNQYAPFNNADQQRCLTGCVATAMAQIMKFWNYPAQGEGQYSYSNAQPMYRHNYGNQAANFGATTYNWPAMPNSIDTTNTDVATLMYQCGVAVSMDYGDENEGGSGAYVLQADVANWQHSAQFAYTNYFKYNMQTMQGVYQADYTSADWIALLKNELSAGRPIQYQGEDASRGGHTWVCDGYDANDMLHMNWGWGGSDNGYFTLSSLTASGFNFSNNEEALIGIEPIVPIRVSVKTTKFSVCAGDSVSLFAQGPATSTYSWTPATGLNCSTCAMASASPSVTTVYTVTVDSAGFKATQSVTVTVVEGVKILNIIGSDATCYGASNGSASITAGGGNSSSLIYNWNSGQSSSSVSGLFAGTYTITVSDSLGCSASSFFSVSQPDSLHVSISTYQTVHTLVYGTAYANVTGGTENYLFNWSNGDNSASISNLSSGDYKLTVTDKNGCTQTAATTISATTGLNEVNKGVSFNAYPNPAKNDLTVEVANLTNGATLSVKNTLGQTLMNRTISDVQSKLDLSQLADGAYFVEVRDGDNSFVKQIIVKK
ncbi:MAG: Peptidase family protein [Bacteroidota bacterium]|nr:Peptidase family protein [Bacteroidota bacterium]